MVSVAGTDQLSSATSSMMPLAFASLWLWVGLVGPTAQWTAGDNPPATATPPPTRRRGSFRHADDAVTACKYLSLARLKNISKQMGKLSLVLFLCCLKGYFIILLDSSCIAWAVSSDLFVSNSHHNSISHGILVHKFCNSF